MFRFFTNKKYTFWELIDSLSRWSGYFSGFLSLFLLFLVFCGVFARYLLRDPIDWRDEVSAYIYIFHCILALPFATLLESHVSAEMLYIHFPKRIQYYITLIGYSLLLICIAFVCYFGTLTTWTYYSRGWRSETVQEFLLWPIMAIIPIGFFLFGLQSLSRMRQVWLRLKKISLHDDKKDS
ncbi:MAG: TRAP transporter small permease subunit [Thermodesulfobacteriota bacterium]